MNSAYRLTFLLSFILLACSERPDLALGTLERDRIELVATVSEVITDVHVREGETVHAGQPIMQLDARVSKAEHAALQANMQQAAARVAELERGPRFEKIAETRARVAGNKAIRLEAEQNLKRIESLLQRGLASKADFDRAEARYNSTVSSLVAEQENLRALENGTTTEELQQARQALAAAQAKLDRSQLLLEKLSIKALRDGVVDELLFKLGEQPRAGESVAVILASGTPYARVYIPQHYRTQVAPGTKLPVYVDGLSKPMQGVVRKVSSDPAFTPYYALTERDRSRLAYLAEIDLVDEQAGNLPAGLPLQVRLGQ